MESVWDYPRPPRLEPCAKDVEVYLGGERIARSDRALRVLETSHPPVIYIPAGDFEAGALSPSDARQSFCEFKGLASYYDVTGGGVTEKAAAWHYPEPVASYEGLRDHVAVYPGWMDRCVLGGEPQGSHSAEWDCYNLYCILLRRGRSMLEVMGHHIYKLGAEQQV